MTAREWRYMTAYIWETDMDNTFLAAVISRGERTARKIAKAKQKMQEARDEH